MNPHYSRRADGSLRPNHSLPLSLKTPRRFGRQMEPSKRQVQWAGENYQQSSPNPEDWHGLLPIDQRRRSARPTPGERQEEQMRQLPRSYDPGVLEGLQYTGREAARGQRAGPPVDEDAYLRQINPDPDLMSGLSEGPPAKYDDFQPHPPPRLSALDKRLSQANQERAALEGLRAGLSDPEIVEHMLDHGAYSAGQARRLLKIVKLRNSMS
jgi:hypothetical protein